MRAVRELKSERSPSETTGSPRHHRLPLGSVLDLQRTAGNRAVSRLLIQRLALNSHPGLTESRLPQRFYYAQMVGLANAFGDNLERKNEDGGENIGVYTDGMSACATIIVRHANGDIFLGHFLASAPWLDYALNPDADEKDPDDKFGDVGEDPEGWAERRSALTEEEDVAHEAEVAAWNKREKVRRELRDIRHKLRFDNAVQVVLGTDEKWLEKHQAARVLKKFYNGPMPEPIVGTGWLGMTPDGTVYHQHNAGGAPR